MHIKLKRKTFGFQDMQPMKLAGYFLFAFTASMEPLILGSTVQTFTEEVRIEKSHNLFIYTFVWQLNSRIHRFTDDTEYRAFYCLLETT